MTETVLITGASRGIGLEFTRQYLAAGCRVHAGARQPEQSTPLMELAGQYRQLLTVHPLDVTRAAHVQALAATLGGQPIDILINNAGIYGQDDAYFGNTDEAKWLETFRTNVVAPMKIMEALVESVAASDRRIMATLSSKMGSMADNRSGGSYVYRSSKAALNAVMVSVAHDLAPRGITAVALHPGWVKTDMGGDDAQIGPAESVERMRGILAGVGPQDSGRFFDIDGRNIPW